MSQTLLASARPSPTMAASSPSDSRARLDEAEAHLGRAKDHLSASPPDYSGALAEVLGSFRASLVAFLTECGATPDAEAPLGALAGRAVRNDSVLKTVVNRAMVLADRAPAIGRSPKPTVRDREDVETGWYTARNLVQTVAGRLAPPA